MTATTNGASLEDCLTNIFSLIDLNGIRWKRFKHKENNYLYTPIDTHPILTTYAKCIEENHIAVWRLEPQKRHSTGGPGSSANNNHPGGSNTGATGGGGGGGGGTGSAAHSNFPTPTRTSNNNTPTNTGPQATHNLSNQGGNQSGNNNTSNNNSNTNNNNNFELWIFGYGHQLKVDNVIGDELIEIEDDNWESKGLSYECRTLLFKALHNLIERCLITKGFTKIGRWFVQPLSKNLAPTSLPANNISTSSFSNHLNLSNTGHLQHNHQHHSPLDKPSKHSKLEPTSINSKNNLSATISSTINRIIECRKELFDSKQCLDKTDGLRHTSLRSSNTYFTTSLDGFKSSLSFAFSFFVHGDSTICATVDVRQHPLVHPLTRADLATFQKGGIVRVALAPYGLNGILNGISYKDSDNGAATTTFIQQWSKFYPLPKTLARLVPTNKSSSNNSAITTNTFNQKTSSNTSNQYIQSNDGLNSRSYLSNLTNMLLPPTQHKPFMYFNHEPSEVPPVVEVIVAGYRMRYPSECVFTTSKVIDLYKSLNAPNSIRSITPTISSKRPNNKNILNKSSKLGHLNEKFTEEKTDSQLTRVKIEPDPTKTQSNFNSPYKLAPVDGNINSKLDSALKKQQTTNSDKNKSLNGCIDGTDSSNNNNNLSGNQTITISRYNQAKVGFGSTNITSLGPTDIGKIYPTPPSLEQIILSPSNLNEETGLKEHLTTLSPANLNIQNELSKDNGIDVYKPVECALMPPPPKWAALTNIIISSSKSLPPECVYKGSPQNNISSKTIVNRFSESIRGNSIKHNLGAPKQFSNFIKNSNNMNSTPSPLTDQTNKNGFNGLNSLNISSPKTPIANSLVTNSATLNSTNFILQPNASSPIISSTTTYSSFTLPHQRLFNNLQEVNSVQLNLLMSDSIIGMFKDHNFESCTLCVCNMSVKGTQIDSIPQRVDNSVSWRPFNNNESLLVGSLLPNEFANECTCGFSAITNRHCSHLSGLFLEDELELTSVLYDPTEMIDKNKLYRKVRLSSYPDNSYSEEQKMMNKLTSDANINKISKNLDDNAKPGIKIDKPRDDKSSQYSHNVLEETKIFVIDQLKQQCSSMIHSNSSLSKVMLIESFRNNRHLTSCSNYYAQTTNKTANSSSPFYRFLDDSNKYTTVKMLNRNPISLKFSDFCELTKSIIARLGTHSQTNSRLINSLVKPLNDGSTNLTSIFSKMFSPNRQTSLLGKTNDTHLNSRHNIFMQGLQALVMPTLSIDAKGALQILEHLVKEEAKEALVTLNKAILIFTSPIHDWQFLGAPVPENNFDVANLLKIIQPSLDESIGNHNKLYKEYVHQQQQHIFSARDSPTGAPTLPTPPCQGPLTWRQFHQAAGRGTEDQCEPQPIPSLLVGHHVEKNNLALSPFALKFWDKLLLEPYAPGHNMFYLVISPHNQNILAQINQFFRELSNTYELMKLGKHVPIGTGIISATLSKTDNIPVVNEDDWFSRCSFNEKDPSNLITPKLRNYASKMNSTLAKTIVEFMEERQPAYDPHADRFDSSPSPQTSKPVSVTTRVEQHAQQSANRTFANLFGTSNISSCPPQENMQGYSSSENQSTSSEISNQIKSQSLIGTSAIHNNAEDNIHQEDEASKQSGIVIYIIDPFSSPSIDQNLRALATIGLFKCYSMLLDNLPENIRRVTQVQLISLDSIVCHSRPILNISRVDQLKSLSMNVYSRCRKILTNQITAKSLTGFGPAAALESFFKTKNAELCITKMFSPPFILAPMKDKQTELGEMFGDRRERSSILFCSYCITEDQRWLLASVTNDKGDMSETAVININIIDRMKRPKTSVKRMALRKLMDFIISVMSDWMNPWRLIIGKLGRVGHGELKEWATLMSKRSLLNYSRHLSEKCRQCTILPPTETVSILSACLVSLEPDSELRIMPDQFTSDDRQASFNKCPLSTPEDASATHILVFPTSASIQSSHGNVEDPLVGSGLDDDLLNQFPLEDGIEDLGVEENMDDLFSAWDDNQTNVTDHNSHHDTMMSSSNLQMGSGSVGDNANNQDETLQLLQQPLALGYYISTAKVGHMPNWFWSTSPHLRNLCPSFLKSALHIHMPCVQLSDDLLHSGVGQSRKSHQLDSNLTTDVLRYVLEGYNSLSWLALNPKTFDRQSCLPVHMQNLLQLYHLMESFS